MRVSSIEKDLAAAAAGGFEVVMAGPGHGAIVVVLRRSRP